MSYNVYNIRNTINKILKKVAPENPALEISLYSIPLIRDNDLGKEEEEGITYKGPSGYGFWTIGDNPDNDIILPRIGSLYTTSFAILQNGGTYYVKELGNINPKYDVVM